MATPGATTHEYYRRHQQQPSCDDMSYADAYEADRRLSTSTHVVTCHQRARQRNQERSERGILRTIAIEKQRIIDAAQRLQHDHIRRVLHLRTMMTACAVASSSAAVTPVCTASVCTTVMQTSSLVCLIGSYLCMPQLHVMRQCCHTLRRIITKYVHTPLHNNGYVAQFWHYLRHDCYQSSSSTPLHDRRSWSLISVALQQYQSDIVAAGSHSYITGSITLAMLTGYDGHHRNVDGNGYNSEPWHTDNLNMMVEGNSRTILAPLNALIQTLQSLANHHNIDVNENDDIMRVEVVAYDSLHAEAPSRDASYRPSSHVEAHVYDNAIKQFDVLYRCEQIHDNDLSSGSLDDAMSSLYASSSQLQQLHRYNERHWDQLHTSRTQTRIFRSAAANDTQEMHVRSIRYVISLRHSRYTKQNLTIDITYVPGNDVLICGGLWQWMTRNCDIDLCINGISPAGLRCYAPHRLESRVMTLRNDSYCRHFDAHARVVPDSRTSAMKRHRTSCIVYAPLAVASRGTPVTDRFVRFINGPPDHYYDGDAYRRLCRYGTSRCCCHTSLMTRINTWQQQRLYIVICDTYDHHMIYHHCDVVPSHIISPSFASLIPAEHDDDKKQVHGTDMMENGMMKKASLSRLRVRHLPASYIAPLHDADWIRTTLYDMQEYRGKVLTPSWAIPTPIAPRVDLFAPPADHATRPFNDDDDAWY